MKKQPDMAFCLFTTAIGTCAVAWNAVGIVGVNLPEASVTALRKRMLARYPEAMEQAPSAKAKRVINNAVALLKGKPVDLSDTPLDFAGLPAFHKEVYELVITIPPGQTLSYGDVAKRLNKPNAARAVGQAMGRNPFPIIVPCHRVLAAKGKLGGFTSHGGLDTKQQMLVIEGNVLPAKRSEVKVKPAAQKMLRRLSIAKAMAHLRGCDATLGQWLDQAGPYRLKVDQVQDVFLTLAEAIVYQQLHGKAAATIFKRVCELFPKSGKFFTPQDILRCSDDKLRGAGLSQNKLLALRDLADKTLRGVVPDIDALHELDDEQIIERLIQVRGIGRWTVQMLLIFRLGRPDVLPMDDFGVRKGFMLTYKKAAMPSPKELHAHGQRWAPYRSVASWYLWRAADQDKKESKGNGK